MSEITDEIQKEAARPHPGFLFAATLTACAAVATYYYQPEIEAATGPTSFVILLIFLVLLSLFLVLCFRSPRIGNRFLGFSIVIDKSEKKASDGYHYSAGFKADTAVDMKRLNSRRKQARYQRRKMAAVTREMQKEKAPTAASDKKSGGASADQE